MKVSELVAILAAMPQDAEIVISTPRDVLSVDPAVAYVSSPDEHTTYRTHSEPRVTRHRPAPADSYFRALTGLAVLFTGEDDYTPSPDRGKAD